MTEQYYVYLAGAMTGLTKEQACAWRATDSTFVKMIMNDGWIPLDPTRAEEPKGADHTYTATTNNHSKHVQRDLNDINKSSAIVLNLTNDDHFSVGTISEMGYAHALRKPIVTVLNGGNKYDHMFVHEMSTVIVPSFRKAVDELVKLKPIQFPAEPQDVAVPYAPPLQRMLGAT